jgi:hypothetical protein
MNGIWSTKIKNELYINLVGKYEGSKRDSVRMNVAFRRVLATVVAVEKQ